MVDIFISYASEDRSRVQPLAKSLEEQGWSVFWDRTIPAGKTWRQVIGDALKNARSVIVAWSKTSVESRWVQEEAERGLKRNVLIPILIDDVEPPLGFGTIQAADLISWEPTQSSSEFQKLIADISAILGPSPGHVKEIERAAENEHKRKQEEERRRKDEEHRKAEEDLQRLEKENRRIAEERQRFEEEQLRAELESKAKEEQKRKEIEAKRKAEEEARRKEADEKAERARKAEAERRAEEERKFKQRLPEKVETTRIETEKPDVKRLHTTRKMDKPIAAGPTRPLWLPILLTSFGWALSGAITGVPVTRFIDFYIRVALSAAIGGLVTAIVLRRIVPGIQWKQGFFITIGWAISWAIGGSIRWGMGGVIGHVIWGTKVGAIGGLVTAIVLRWIAPDIQWKQVFFITIGWVISWAIGGTIGWDIEEALGQTIGWDIAAIIGPAIGWAITGALGGGVMFLVLHQTMRRD